MLPEKSRYRPKTCLGRFMDRRLPLLRMIHDLSVNYPVPKNLDYFYTFGGILTLMLISQMLTGIVMAMHYVPDVTLAFESRERFMRDDRFGWLFVSWHAVGASFFFIAAYIHLARGLYYGSHKAPREVVWIIGVLIYLIMMATAFMGYVLVWGMMSSSAAAVVAGLFNAIPVIGPWLHETLLGGYSVGQPTLNRFYALHYLLPFVLVFLIVLHIWAVHVAGQNNPAGIDVRSEKETVPFVPYVMIKDIFAIFVFLVFLAWFLFYMPDYMGHPDNYVQADPLKTSQHVMPEWYFLPFYAMLRAVTFDIGPISSTLGGVIVLAASVLVFLFVPWLDRSQIRSARYRPLYRVFYWLFVADVIFLGWLGSRPADDLYVIWSQAGTAFYFLFFLVVMPFLPRFEKKHMVPASIEEAMRRKRMWRHGR